MELPMQPLNTASSSSSLLSRKNLNGASNSELTAFNAFVFFISELQQNYKKNVPLMRYVVILNKTKFIHVDAIRRHLDSFTKFIIPNLDIIQHVLKSRCKLVLNKSRLEYNEGIYIDFSELESECSIDVSNSLIIAEHLAAIYAQLYNDVELMCLIQALPDQQESKQEITNMNSSMDDLNSLVADVAPYIDANEKEPMNAVMKILDNPEALSAITQKIQAIVSNGGLLSMLSMLKSNR
jgi:hypothetical protein